MEEKKENRPQEGWKPDEEKKKSWNIGRT